MKEKRRERFARKQIGGDQSEANGGTDFFLENNFNCSSKQSERSVKTIIEGKRTNRRA